MTTTTEDLWATAGDTAVGSADDPWSTNTEPPSDAYQNPYEMPATESDDSWLNGPDAVSAPATPSASFTDAPATGEPARISSEMITRDGAILPVTLSIAEVRGAYASDGAVILATPRAAG